MRQSNDPASQSVPRVENLVEREYPREKLTEDPDFQNLTPHLGQFRDFWRVFRKNKLAVGAFLVLALISAAALSAPLLAPYHPTITSLNEKLKNLPPSSRHILGTDNLGFDIYSRILFGSRVSLTVGFLTAVFSVFIGTIYGAYSGYYGGRVDTILMRFVDILLSLPTMFLLIIFAAFVKPGAVGIALIIGSTSWMSIARLVRGEFLRLKEQDFVEASRGLGFSSPRIIFNTILPNVTAPIIVNATLMVAYSIIYESTLSFLGLGIQFPQFSWGSMLTNAQDIILLKEAPWIAVFPGLAIFITVLCFNFLGDGLRDALDPKLKNVK